MNGLRRGMAEIVWSNAALYELIEIRAYITIFDPAAADRMVAKLTNLGNALADFPHRGRPSGDGLRELTTVPPYILRYEVLGDRVTILRVRHGARNPLN